MSGDTEAGVSRAAPRVPWGVAQLRKDNYPYVDVTRVQQVLEEHYHNNRHEMAAAMGIHQTYLSKVLRGIRPVRYSFVMGLLYIGRLEDCLSYGDLSCLAIPED